jgi:hypothetical protein
MSDNNVQSLLEATMADLGPKLAERAKEQLTAELTRSIGYTVSEVTKKFVETWTRDNILPEVIAQLEAQKPQLIAVVVAGVHAACRQLAAGLERSAIERMSSSWNMAGIVKELFGR